MNQEVSWVPLQFVTRWRRMTLWLTFLGCISLFFVTVLSIYAVGAEQRIDELENKVLCMEASWGQEFIGGASSTSTEVHNGHVTEGLTISTGCVSND
jgi:hypothetical protein